MTQITLAEWFSRSLRDEQGNERMTMVALEAKAKVGRSTLYRIRDGKGPVGENTIRAIAEALDVPMPTMVQMVELEEGQPATVFDLLDRIRELTETIEAMLADRAAETILAAILDRRGGGTEAEMIQRLEAMIADQLRHTQTYDLRPGPAAAAPLRRVAEHRGE